MTIRDKILNLFESNKGVFFSGEEIAKNLGVSRAAVWKAVSSLRSSGYPIEAVNNKGYCLSQHTDILSPQGIRKYLTPICQHLQLEMLPSVTSTNDQLRLTASQNQEGQILIAGEQTGGKGRLGRSFYSPKDTGIYLSILLRPVQYTPQNSTDITTMAAAAMCEAIESVTQERPQIKWVNDIFIRGRKVCGILTEGSFSLETGLMEYAVLGAGINVYPPLEGFPPDLSSIAGSVLESPQPDAKNRLSAAFLNRFMDYYTQMDSSYRETYRRYSMVIGKPILVCTGNQERTATALDIDDRCRLLVRYENGETQALSYGEIRIRPADAEKSL